MNLIEWKYSYSLNIDFADAQHKELIKMINELYQAKLDKSDSSLLSKILIDIVNYTQNHLKDEEEFLTKIGYPDIFEHKAQHKFLRNKIIEILERYKKGETDVTDVLLDLLKTWLIKHILKHDKAYATYFFSKK